MRKVENHGQRETLALNLECLILTPFCPSLSFLIYEMGMIEFGCELLGDGRTTEGVPGQLVPGAPCGGSS